MRAEHRDPAEEVLQQGSGRRTVREADGVAVRKTFTAGSLEERIRMADDELARLDRFHAALAGVPGATCPRPLGRIDGPAPGYRMSWVEGEDLAVHLDRRRVPDAELARMGRTIAVALRAYVAALGEPYYDLKIGNVLVAPTGDLGFVDVGLPEGAVPPVAEDTAYEVSVGNLLASMVFDSGRPLYFFRRRYHRQSGVVAAALVAALQDAGRPLHSDHLLAETERAYRRNTFGRGSPVRTLWYASVGRLVGRRFRTAAGVVGPVPFRQK